MQAANLPSLLLGNQTSNAQGNNNNNDTAEQRARPVIILQDITTVEDMAEWLEGYLTECERIDTRFKASGEKLVANLKGVAGRSSVS